MAYSALRCATAMIRAAAQKSQPRVLAERREAIIAPMIEKLTARSVFSSQ
jgi:RES domain-containing protein